jgi:response regulator receiver domain-containing protein
MPNRDGIDTLREIRQLYPNLPVIMVSGAPSPVNIVNSMKCGATDFLCKPVTHEDLRRAITRALDTKTVECLRPLKSASTSARAFFGKSPQMAVIQSLLAQVGWSEAPVFSSLGPFTKPWVEWQVRCWYGKDNAALSIWSNECWRLSFDAQRRAACVHEVGVDCR